MPLNRTRGLVLAGAVGFFVGLGVSVLLGRVLGPEPVDRERLAQLEAAADTARREYESARDAFRDSLEALPDSAEVAERDRRIREDAAREAREIQARIASNRTRSARQAGDLRGGLEALGGEALIPLVDSLENAIDVVAVEKDREREVAVEAEKAVADGLRNDIRRMADLLAGADEALTKADTAIARKDRQIEFLTSEVNRLERGLSFSLFGLRCKIGPGVAGGITTDRKLGAAAGGSITC